MTITQDELNALTNRVRAMERAEEFKASESGKWFTDAILGAMNDKAIELLAHAKTEEDRLLAQQVLLGSREPQKLLDSLVRQGELAIQTIKDFSALPPQEDENHEQA